MPGCRIGKIKLKSGGVIHRLPTIQRDEAQQALIDRAVRMASAFGPSELAGYMLVGWGADGDYSTAYFIGEDSPIGRGMAPSFIADAMRRRMIEEGDWG